MAPAGLTARSPLDQGEEGAGITVPPLPQLADVLDADDAVVEGAGPSGVASGGPAATGPG
jgi:hypothetical protein